MGEEYDQPHEDDQPHKDRPTQYEDLFPRMPAACRPPTTWKGQHSYTVPLKGARVTVLLRQQAFYIKPADPSQCQALLGRPLPRTGGCSVAWRTYGGLMESWKLCHQLAVDA